MNLDKNMVINPQALKDIIDEVIGGAVLTAKEQKELLKAAYWSVITLYLMKRQNTDAAYISALKAQIKGLVIDGVNITDTDRNTLLNSMYTKALSYSQVVVAINRGGNSVPGYPVINMDASSTPPLTINYNGYYLMD